MKKHNLIMMAVAATLAIGSSGCSLFNKSERAQGWKETGQNDAQKVDDEVKATSGRVKKDTNKAIAEVNEKLQEMADEMKYSNLSGDWAIETVLGKKAVGETAPFIKFNPSENRIYGNNGCNVINAQYEINSKSKTISFGNLISTMMLCAQTDITDAEIGEALGSTKSYSLEISDPDQILTFYNAEGKKVMTLMHRDFHFLDGIWTVEKIDGENVDIDGMKLALDVEEKRMHGNTGCNIINGELETDMETANSISFSKIGMTKMACPNSGWETRMMVALEDAVTAGKISNDEIEFLGSNGQQVMLLKRTASIDE